MLIVAHGAVLCVCSPAAVFARCSLLKCVNNQMNSCPSDAPPLINQSDFMCSPCSPTLLDLVEIERKLREAKAEREKLLRERVSHLSRETLADSTVVSADTLVRTRLSGRWHPLRCCQRMPECLQCQLAVTDKRQRSRVRCSRLCRLQADRENIEYCFIVILRCLFSAQGTDSLWLEWEKKGYFAHACWADCMFCGWAN